MEELIMLLTVALYMVGMLFIFGCAFELILVIINGIRTWFKDTKEIIDNMKSNTDSDNK